MSYSLDELKKLREQTGAGVMDVRNALEETDGDVVKAKKILTKKGFERAAKRAERATTAGKVFSYIHHSGKVGSLVEIMCETDFVAKNEVFENLGREVAMQIASMNPKDEKELVKQDYIRDTGKKIKDLFTEAISKTGENIKLGKFVRVELGQ